MAAAGNFGKNLNDEIQYGGVTAPGNAPWVLTVGAYSHMGTPDAGDDRVAGYSSRGPTAFDFAAKPDLVAPGTRIVSLNDNDSALALRNPADLVAGTEGGAYPYLTLSGTSMAAPVVSGVVARMLQANPGLTPNAVKAVLQYTATVTPNVDALSQGAGFLNGDAAVSLARFYAASSPGDSYTTGGDWSRQIIWGNRRVSGGVLQPWGSAWGTNIIWGSTGDNIIWAGCTAWRQHHLGFVEGQHHLGFFQRTTSSGVRPRTTSSGVRPRTTSFGVRRRTTSSGARRRTTSFGARADNIIWGSNVVWGSACAGRDCENIIWGSVDPGENIIWGSGRENIIWGSGNDNIIWGSGHDNIIWGSGGDNIIWGSGGDNIIWGSSLVSDNGLAGEDGGLAGALGAGRAAGR